MFIHHTSASIIICENAGPDVRVDLETFMSDLVPDGDPMFIHTSKGPDNASSCTLYYCSHRANDSGCKRNLGIGYLSQGMYLWEHRHSGHTRNITVTMHGNVK